VKKFAIAATALALFATTITVAPANAAAVLAKNARYGTQCATLNQVAVGRGADGGNLVCKVETAGTFKGKKIWAYAKFPTISALEITIPAAPGGYEQVGRAMATAMVAEGILKSEALFVNRPGAGGTIGLNHFLNYEAGARNKAMVMGFALVGGVISTKNTAKNSSLVPAARVMGEYEVIAVAADSPYKTLADLVKDIKAQKTSLPIAGGNLGGIDHYTAVSFYEALGLTIKDLNYVVYSGGEQITAALLNGSSKAGIAGYGEFKAQVAAGTLRLLGVTSPSKVSAIPANTFRAQGVNLVSQNWRGIMLPKGTSKANRNLFIRAMDVARSGKSWKTAAATNSWMNNWLAGDAYLTWLKAEEAKLAKLYKDAGL
jgi:putative tricarboxylic transport membrane protein